MTTNDKIPQLRMLAPYQALCVLAFTWKKRASELISRNH